MDKSMKVTTYKSTIEMPTKSGIGKSRRRKLAIVNLKPDDKDHVIEDLPIHHIQILDRSGSMTGQIDRLIENVKMTIDHMKESDFFSIIWFSGHEQYRTLIKGASVKSDRSYSKLLDSIKSTLGTTCFSDPVKEAKSIVSELRDLCPNFSVTLFTDGAPVCPWSSNEEDVKVSDLISSMKNDIISFNTIGYGGYYNGELLRKWSNLSSYGMFTHSSKIDEYLSIFDSVTENISEVEKTKIDIKLNSDGLSAFHSTKRSVKMFSPGSKLITINYSNKYGDQFIFLSDSDKDFSVKINDDEYDTKDMKDMGSISKTEIPYIYRMAYASYDYGMCGRELSRDLLLAVRDKNLIDSHISSFSNEEIGNHTKLLKKAAFSTSARNTESAPDGYIPSSDTPCVMDLIQDLGKMNAKIVPDLIEYQRIGRKVNDTLDAFEPKKYEECSIIDVILSKDRMNVGIRFVRSGYVRLDKEKAYAVGLPIRYPVHVFRTYTIVKDGHLNVNRIAVTMKLSAFNSICNKFNFVKNVNYELSGQTSNIEWVSVIFILNSIPVVNANCCDSTSSMIYNLVTKESELECAVKTIKYLINKTYEVDVEREKKYRNGKDIESNDPVHKLNDDQVEVLKSHGIMSNGTYTGVDVSVDKACDSDFYIANSVKFEIKGMSSLPKIDDVVSAYKKASCSEVIEKLNKRPAYYLINEQYKKYKLMSRHDLKDSLEDINGELIKTRFRIASIKIGKIMTGQWFNGFINSGKENVYEYTDSSDSLKLLMKVSKIKAYI